MEHNSRLAQCGPGRATSFQTVQYGKGQESNFNLTAEKLANAASAWRSRSTSPGTGHVMAWRDVVRTALYLCVLPPPNLSPQSHHEEKNQTNPNGETFYQIAGQYSLKTVKNIQSKEILRNVHGLEALKETWQLNVMWYHGVVSKTKAIWIMYG